MSMKIGLSYQWTNINYPSLSRNRDLKVGTACRVLNLEGVEGIKW
jgi:hypothetical protein